MEVSRRNGQEDKTVFVGVDLHRFRGHATVRTEDSEVFSGVLPGQCEALRGLLDRFWIPRPPGALSSARDSAKEATDRRSGTDPESDQGKTSVLCHIRFGNRWIQESFERLLEEYGF